MLKHKDQKILKVLQANGYKILEDTPNYTILQKENEQIYVESWSVNLRKS